MQEEKTTDDLAYQAIGNAPVHKLQDDDALGEVLVLGYLEIVRGGQIEMATFAV